MVKKNIKLNELKVPWITKEGYLDFSKFPIDSILVQAISKDVETIKNGCSTLGSMILTGRVEAAVFLYGLMRYHASDITKKTIVVEALKYAKSIETANVLFEEMRAIESSNKTRSYIKTIMKCLQHFPIELIQEGFEKLLQDKKWSYRMKRQFKDILGIDPKTDPYWDDEE